MVGEKRKKGVKDTRASGKTWLLFTTIGKHSFGKEGQGELGVLFWIAKCQKPIGHLNGDVGEAGHWSIQVWCLDKVRSKNRNLEVISVRWHLKPQAWMRYPRA